MTNMPRIACLILALSFLVAGCVSWSAIRIELALGRVSRPRLPARSWGIGLGIFELAAMLGYDTRTDFEDTLTLPDGTRAENNAALIAAALRIVAELVLR